MPKAINDTSAVIVEHVAKHFILPTEKTNSIKSGLISAIRGGKKTASVQHALNDISFSVKYGEFFGILGRNGSGKSTLLKILAEIYQPTKGSVTHNGKLVPFIELGVGFNPELTGRENVYLNGALLGFSRQEIEARYDDIVQFAELDGFMDQKLKNYSSGMQVRLAFSVATRAEADILLIDEVLAVGDESFQRKCYEYFKSLKKQKKTIIFVSHDMAAVREFCDRAILIADGKIAAEGTGETIANKYSQLFLDRLQDDKGGELDNRWGDGRAMYTDIQLEKETLREKDKLVFRVTFEAKKHIDSIVAGSSLTNSAGVEYCGTNTEHKKIKIKNLKKGERVSIRWEYPNIFTDGRHYINLSLHGRAGGAVADWWTEAAHFNVVKPEKSPFVTLPDVQVDVQ